MPQSGNTGFRKVIHPLDTEDGDRVGPGAWTLRGGATLDATAKFGKSLFTNASTEDILSDSALAGADVSDTAKTMWHFWWRTDTLAANQTMCNFTDSLGQVVKGRIFFEVTKLLKIRWRRTSDLTSGDPVIQVASNSNIVATGRFISIVGYLRADSASEGKLFIDGEDQTGSVASVTGTTELANNDFLQIGNNGNGLDPARFVDHLTIIQSSSLSDAKAVSLATQYWDTRGFGYDPEITSLSESSAPVGAHVVATGIGFGRDVVVRVGGVASPSVVREEDSSVAFEVPTLVPATYDVELENLESGVIWTTPSGLSVVAAAGVSRSKLVMGSLNI